MFADFITFFIHPQLFTLVVDQIFSAGRMSRNDLFYLYINDTVA